MQSVHSYIQFHPTLRPRNRYPSPGTTTASLTAFVYINAVFILVQIAFGTLLLVSFNQYKSLFEMRSSEEPELRSANSNHSRRIETLLLVRHLLLTAVGQPRYALPTHAAVPNNSHAHAHAHQRRLGCRPFVCRQRALDIRCGTRCTCVCASLLAPCWLVVCAIVDAHRERVKVPFQTSRITLASAFADQGLTASNSEWKAAVGCEEVGESRYVERENVCVCVCSV
jgi:hypothetical protein